MGKGLGASGMLAGHHVLFLCLGGSYERVFVILSEAVHCVYILPYMCVWYFHWEVSLKIENARKTLRV